jgi:hypothetical protein
MEKKPYGPELRRDDYFILDDINLGLKLRNAETKKPLLELKVRSKTKANGMQ